MNNDYDSAGYSDMLTDFGFFVLVTIACMAFGALVYLVML